MSYPFYNIFCYEPNKVELQSEILAYQFEHITKNGWMFVIMISFLCRISWNQRCSETPQFVTNKMDIRGFHFPPKVTTTFNILNITPLHSKSPIELIT